MSDLIDRQVAIDAIERHIRTAEEPYQLTYTDKVSNHAFEISASCIYNLPSAQVEPHWIPCNERLPEEKQDVLLAFKHNMVVGFWEDILNDGSQTWYANSGNGYFTDMDVLSGYDDPIAWMPLPEPYVGRRTDE